MDFRQKKNFTGIRSRFFAFLLLSFVIINFQLNAEEEQISLESRLKQAAEQATSIAAERLAKNPKDPKGLLLIKFAKFFYSDYKPLLLLRGQLRYKTKIEKPKKEVTELEFLSSLIKIVDSIVNAKDTSKKRKLMAVLYSMIRTIQPGNEDALINLILLEDNGTEVNIERLLAQNLSDFENFQSVEYDKKDSRYIVSNIKKTIHVPANTPWTDTWVKVKEGKIIRVEATKLWSMGKGPFPFVGADGYSNLEINKIVKNSQGNIYSGKYLITKLVKTVSNNARKFKGSKAAKLGCLLAKIGKKVYTIGEEATFMAESSGPLYFGPFEWDDYSDNYGELMVTFEVSDK